MSELKSCPFCGAPGEYRQVVARGQKCWQVLCTNMETCPAWAFTEEKASKKIAAASWNTRAQESA